MPARSVIDFVLNTTDTALNLVMQYQRPEHGEWSPGGMSPTTIPPGGSGHFGSESDGFLTGTQGSVGYSVSEPDDHPGNFYWDNPFMFLRSKLMLHVAHNFYG